MQKLLSLPPNLIHCFHELEEVNHTDWFCTSDPIGRQTRLRRRNHMVIASLHQAFAPQESFSNWIGHEKRILLHAGGQSRRLPSYGPSGKILTPIPIFSWERGQRLGQNLLVFATSRYTKESCSKRRPDEYIDSQWRCIYPFGKTFAGHSQCGRRMLRLMGKSFSGHSSRSFLSPDREALKYSTSCYRSPLWKNWKGYPRLTFS